MLLVAGLVMAIREPRTIRRAQSTSQTVEDRSDQKHWNNDASLQWPR